jgi:hypothetical protein
MRNLSQVTNKPLYNRCTVQVVISLDHHMGRVAKPKTLKSLPFIEVWALERSLNMNKSIKISMTLGEYPGVIPSNNFVGPCD